MDNQESIGFYYAEKYCVDCKRKEGYNGNRPLTAPSKCRYCGGRMTDEQSEKMRIEFQKSIRKAVKNNKNIMKTIIQNEDKIQALEELKSDFADDNQYLGISVKLIIDNKIRKLQKIQL